MLTVRGDFILAEDSFVYLSNNGIIYREFAKGKIQPLRKMPRVQTSNIPEFMKNVVEYRRIT